MSNALKNRLEQYTEDQLKSNIERIIKSYRHTWDIYAELLQNAADAIFEKFGQDKVDEGQIKLEIFTEERKIIITDNGVGIPHDKLSNVLVTGESLKRAGNAGKHGFMGFGLTFIGFQTSYLKITSIHDGISHSCTYSDLYKTVFEESDIPQSLEELSGTPFTTAEDDLTGTIMEIHFPLEFPIDSIENNLKLAFEYPKHDKLFEYILRTRSVVGNVETINDGVENFRFIFELNGQNKEITPSFMAVDEIVTRVLHGSDRIFDISDYETSIIKPSKDLDNSMQTNVRKVNLIKGKYFDQKIGVKGTILADFYIYGTSKQHLLNYTNTINESISSEPIDVGNGVWLALDGMPTGICLDTLERDLPYTVYVDVKSEEVRRELDAGRKGITSYRANQIVDHAQKLMRDHNYKRYQSYVTGGRDPRIANPLFEPKKELIAVAAGRPGNEFGLHSTCYPAHEEQEVIAIFTELCALNLIKGYTLKALSGYQVYDGLYDYSINIDENDSSDIDQLKIHRSAFNVHGRSIESTDRLIEFKMSLKGLFNDIDRYRKDPNHIDVLVTWSDEIELASKYIQEKGAQLIERITQDTPYFGVTHLLILPQRINPLPVISLEKVFSVLPKAP